MSSILGPKGSKWVEIGGDKSWGRQRVKGDICVSFQWLDIPGKREPQPCMVLFPVVLKLDGGAYAIPQDNAHEYGDSKGNPTPYLMTAAMNAAQTMGFFPDQSTCFRIVDIIIDALPELIRMPSEPPAAYALDFRTTHGIEATAKVSGQIVHQEVI